MRLQRRIPLWDEIGDKNGEYATVYPLGSKCIATTGVCGHTWNGGQCCFSFEDDETFLVEVIDRTVQELKSMGYGSSSSSSSRPVFMFGFSAGSVMSHRIACTHSGRISGIAAVSGTLNVQGTSSLHKYREHPFLNK
jgi:poly(3-hydroxybutyrate) depolymerase